MWYTQFIRPLLSPDDNAGGAGGTGEGTPAGEEKQPDGDKIQLSRADYDALIKLKAERESLDTEVKSLRTYKEQARLLLKPGGDPEITTKAMRELMADAGYTREQIDNYIAEQNAGGGEDEQEPEDRGQRRRGAREEEPDELDTVKGELENVKANQRRAEQTRLKNLLEGSVEASLDKHKILSTLLESGFDGETRSPEVREQAAAQLQADVRKETLERLRARSQEYDGKLWKDEWIAEEALKAADTVAKRYQILMGNPSRLGPNRGGRMGDEEFSKRQRVAEPTRKMPRDQQERQAKDWISDQLEELAHEVSNNGTKA